MTTIKNALDAIVSKIDAHTADYFVAKYGQNGANEWIDRRLVHIDERRKFFVLVRDGSVLAFIDKRTGDIYKPASFKAPAKGIRGNLLNDDGGLSAFQFGCLGLTYVVYTK